MKSRAEATGSTQSTASGPYKRPATTTTTSEESPKKNYTPEQVKLCKSIMSKKDYYDILGVDKKSTDDEIKKSYKKLALRLHPDKNSAPNATDAFKKVSSAYMCLSDEQKKRVYDQHGTEDNFRQNYGQYFREEEEFDPFDLFDLFTGGHQNRNRVYRQRRRPQPQNHNHGQGQQERSPWQQFMPLIFLLLVFLMANIGGNLGTGPSFSLSKTESYHYELQTSHHNVTYYVDQSTYDMIRDSSRTTANLESQVENDYYKYHVRK
jgi:DnaJ family protein B protein 12